MQQVTTNHSPAHCCLGYGRTTKNQTLPCDHTTASALLFAPMALGQCTQQSKSWAHTPPTDSSPCRFGASAAPSACGFTRAPAGLLQAGAPMLLSIVGLHSTLCAALLMLPLLPLPSSGCILQPAACLPASLPCLLPAATAISALRLLGLLGDSSRAGLRSADFTGVVKHTCVAVAG
jgi:hypothetical protein